MDQRLVSPADAARRLGVSSKALRLYEDRGLLVPERTRAGWRAYSSADLSRAREIIKLRKLGLSLTQIVSVMNGQECSLEPALRTHLAALEARRTQLAETINQVRSLRRELAAGGTPALTDLTRLETTDQMISFDLPWPWGGERFEAAISRPLAWITGPLGSGKTRLAERLAEAITGCAFLDLDRQTATANGDHHARVKRALGWLIEDGATCSDTLVKLISLLEVDGPAALVVDLIEHDLDHPTQLALAAWLRLRGPDARPIFAMTRSSAMLDLAACGPDETIILCPANHSLPLIVKPHAGSPGYEAVATCLAPPDVRARTEGVIAFRPPAA